jgi:opacity protein-like surface antigen
LLATVANAADAPMYQPPPPPPQVMQPICVPRAQAYMWPGVPICLEEEFATWYLRGDIGMTNQKVKRLDNFLYVGNSINSVGLEFDSSMLFGLGVGMQYNNWLRVDLTGEFRGNSDFNGLDIVNSTYTDEYHAKKREWLFLLNAYVDLGTWWCLTPFVGAGIGFSQVTISNFTDICTTCSSNGNAAPGVAFADSASQWNFAWALHAGLAFQASNNVTIELAYRYVSLGDGISGDIVTFDGINNVNNPMTFKDITSHDFKIGFRWVCCDTAPPPPPPPPPPMVYQPMPQPQLYAPPPQPLMRRG